MRCGIVDSVPGFLKGYEFHESFIDERPVKLSLGPAKKPSSGTISEAIILLRDVFSQSYWGPGKLPYVFGGSFMRSATNTPRTPRSAAAAIA